MSWSGPGSGIRNTTELFDTEEVLDAKVKRMAEKLRVAKHAIAFTGAGISTSAGLRDFRSGMDTILETGPGKWELLAHHREVASGTESSAKSDRMEGEASFKCGGSGSIISNVSCISPTRLRQSVQSPPVKQSTTDFSGMKNFTGLPCSSMIKSESELQSTVAKKKTNALNAYPTFTHMALKTLIDRGILQFLISQNTDGLHRRSGIPKRKMAELHGNTNLETCALCGQEYLRDFRTRCQKKAKSHETGRFCERPGCGGQLLDTIINFNESLPQREIASAYRHSELADFCLSLGSSLSVYPAADCPATVGRKRKTKQNYRGGNYRTHNRGDLFIVNLQGTQLDKLATERLGAKCDDVMQRLMRELGEPVPAWTLQRGLRIQIVRPPAHCQSKRHVFSPDDCLADIPNVNETVVDKLSEESAGDSARLVNSDSKAVGRGVVGNIIDNGGVKTLSTDSLSPGVEGEETTMDAIEHIVSSSPTSAILRMSDEGAQHHLQQNSQPRCKIIVSGVNIESRTPYSLLSCVEFQSTPGTASSCRGPIQPSSSRVGADAPDHQKIADNVFDKKPTESSNAVEIKVVSEPPYVHELNAQDVNTLQRVLETTQVRCSFMGHYNEPDLTLPCQEGLYSVSLDFTDHVSRNKWVVRKVEEHEP